ncbi:hypothetical protein EUR61_14915 [Salmonella enterica subsp. enterica serovar Newport]|nr:hypothetical protein [Salmonella enterica subsp. enterica]EAM2865306.1 hypothetical protein [Salmonella enterica]EAU2801841.1 hypothetical protein [Salmonella enterica subsp. enterica serovar Typhimurium var. 5-]EBS6252776.1 hypothetical protein [Salmonella enterica subsp. enterica serovar Chester]EBV4393286.1 hypothetical protein [Salmonella enterica subsp. enterica serovar Newport]ECE8868758.1 hypothetical protein [Salmonella enterica subsp. enterica serovar Sundsvall]ECS5768002.1 hypoth
MWGKSPDSKFLFFLTLLRKAFAVLFSQKLTYVRFCETPEDTEKLNDLLKVMYTCAPSPKRD